MQVLTTMILLLLLVMAIVISFSKKLLPMVMVFTFYSLLMSIIWLLMESPDLAITEAAVGAGITTVLYFVVLKRINVLEHDIDKDLNGEDDYE